jgi:hypothetical protein
MIFLPDRRSEATKTEDILGKVGEVEASIGQKKGKKAPSLDFLNRFSERKNHNKDRFAIHTHEYDRLALLNIIVEKRQDVRKEDLVFSEPGVATPYPIED